MTKHVPMTLVHHYGCGCQAVTVVSATMKLEPTIGATTVTPDDPFELPECQHRNMPFRIEATVPHPSGVGPGITVKYKVTGPQPVEDTPIVCGA